MGWKSGTPVFRIGQAPTGQNRRLEWTGASLRMVSDGLSIDENGVRLANGTLTDLSKTVTWGPAGPTGSETTKLADDGTTFSLWHRTGTLRLINNDSTSAGKIRLHAGEAGVQQHWLEITPTTLFTNFGGPTKPIITLKAVQTDLGMDTVSLTYLQGAFYPFSDATGQIGNHFNRWALVTAMQASIGMGAAAPTHTLQLGTDDAYKTASSTWAFGCDLRAKRDVVPLDLGMAVRAVRDTRLIRFTYNGAFGTPEGAEGIGVDASEAAQVLPRSVAAAGPDGLLGWNAHELLMCTVAAVQGLLDRVDALEGKVH